MSSVSETMNRYFKNCFVTVCIHILPDVDVVVVLVLVVTSKPVRDG